MAGDGSMRAVSITKRARLEEPEAADGITRRSPKPLAADGAGIAKKRARKPEKSSKMGKGAEEKSKRSKKKRAEEKNKQPNKVEVVKYVSKKEEKQVMTELAEKSKKKMLVRHEINQADMGPFLSEEIWSYVMSIDVFTFKDCTIHEIEMSCDPSTEDRRHANRRRRIENQANLLRQYRINGHAVIQYEITDDERDAEV